MSMKLTHLQEAKTSNQIARAKKRYVYLVKSDRLRVFKPRISSGSANERVIFRVSISSAYKDQLQDDYGKWVDSRTQQFAKDFAEEHGIPYTDFEVIWPKFHRSQASMRAAELYILSIRYNFQ